jgi:hypothetical protein
MEAMFDDVRISRVSEALAGEVRRRVAAGEMTGAGLARRTLLSQSGVANWLGGRRRLSVSACECVMVALRLDVRQVLGLAAAAPVSRPKVTQMPRRPEVDGRGPAWVIQCAA